VLEIRKIMLQRQLWQIVCKTLSHKYLSQKRAGGLPQGRVPEFKPQFCPPQQKKKTQTWIFVVKNGEQKWKIAPVSGVVTCGRVEDIRKGCRIWYKYYIFMYKNGITRPDETIPGMGLERIKENAGGMKSTMVYYKNFCKCHNITPLQ
jgi:hypothetical protein